MTKKLLPIFIFQKSSRNFRRQSEGNFRLQPETNPGSPISRKSIFTATKNKIQTLEIYFLVKVNFREHTDSIADLGMCICTTWPFEKQ